MKKYYRLTQALFLIVLTFNSFGQANTELSNLVSPTRINVNLLPQNDNNKNIGSSGKSWKDIYLDGYLYMDGARMLSNPASHNLTLGSEAGNTAMTGVNNTLLGDSAGAANTSGYENVAVGAFAGKQTSIGYLNTFIGTGAGGANTSGDGNTFVGHNAGAFYLNGDYNSFFGYGSGASSTAGENNSFFGTVTGVINSGSDNSFYGSHAGYGTQGGSSNSVFGSSAGFDLEDGSQNSFFGKNAGMSTSSSYNSFFGSEAGLLNSTGVDNSFVGYQAGRANTTGNFNVFIGQDAGTLNTTGGSNTFVGEDAGNGNTTGSSNTYIGNAADGSSATFVNSTALGNGATVNASNKIRLGNSSVTTIEGTVVYTVSDGRFKKEIRQDVPGLEFINKLRPVTYNFQARNFDEFLNQHRNDDLKQKLQQTDYAPAEKIRHTGFIAQEVEQAAKEINYDFNGVHIPENEGDNYSLAYAEFVVPLVKAIQELDAENKDLKSENASLKSRLDKIEQQLGITNEINKNSITLTNARLEQNAPNPFNNSTIISYFIPDHSASASLQLVTNKGEAIKSFEINEKGNGKLIIYTDDLPSGIYQYSLYADGKIVDTKQMIISK